MKNFFLAAGLSATLLGAASCSEDFDVAAPYKDISVVYGILNMGDTANYIRIQKAFLSQDRAAADMAKDADSSYFTNIRVDIKEINGASATVVQTALPRVDMTAENFPKDAGTFFTTPNYAYKTKYAFRPDRSYRLVITNLNTGNVDSAETVIIPNDNDLLKVLDLDPALTPQPEIRLTTDYSVRLLSVSANAYAVNHAYLYEGILRFHYVDRNTVTGQQTDRSFDWLFDSRTYNAGNQLTGTSGDAYTAIINGMGTPAANIERYIDSTDLIINATTREWFDFRLDQESSNGITADQIQLNYTNIRGKDVRGLFTARARRIGRSIPFDARTLAALRGGDARLAPLRIVGVSDH